ncbi:MAG: carotenoid biosynthesis protein, partial [Chloroflexi bacterium]|nr:carotenoid biosynthesis protein [Chloroflexota bacterium]
DGLLALNIDLAMDAIAIRLGMWDWGRGFSFQYFGVPYANFWAWFWVVSSFSFGYRLLYQRDDWIGKWLAPLIAVIVGLIGVIGTNAFITFVVPLEVRGSTVIITLSLAIGLIIYLRPKFHIHAVDPLVFWVPLISHIYFLVAGFASGAILNPTFLLLVSAIMFGVALYLHYPTLAKTFAR